MAKKTQILSSAPAGAGRKRPQLNIPIELLEVDDQNPRIADEHKGGTQVDIMTVLYGEFDLEEVAYSMAENGYFDEEPIVVVPKKLPKGFSLADYNTVEKQQVALEELIATKKIEFIVVEGNRRTATAKLLLDAKLRRLVGVDSEFPTPKTKATAVDLAILPAILYPDRNEVSPYLGVRHIAGIMRWDAYAIARYIARNIENPAFADIPLQQRIKNIQAQIGDRSDVIRKQYIFYKVVEQAEQDAGLNMKPVKSRFSLVSNALGSPTIRDYIGLGSFKDLDLTKPLIPENKYENLGRVFTWIFGNGKDKQPIFTDSRLISSRLAPILADEFSTQVLEKTSSIEQAYEMSGGERNYVVKNIETAARNIQMALSLAWKYKTDEHIVAATRECGEVMDELKKMLG